MANLHWMVGLVIIGVLTCHASELTPSPTPPVGEKNNTSTNISSTVKTTTPTPSTANSAVNSTDTTAPSADISTSTSTSTENPKKLPVSQRTTVSSSTSPTTAAMKTTSAETVPQTTENETPDNTTGSSTTISPTTSAMKTTSTETESSTTTALNTSTTPTPAPTTTPTPTPTTTPTPAPTTPTPTPTTTPTPTPTTTPTPAPTTTPTPQKEKILINEFTFTGLFSEGNEFFVELKRQNAVDMAVTVVVLDGGSGFQCQELKKVSSAWTNDLTMAEFNLTKTNRQSIVVALYETDAWTTCADYKANVTLLRDAVVLSKTTNIVDRKKIAETFNLAGPFSVLVANESKLKVLKGTYSISRCDDAAMNVGSFVVATETKGATNNCSMIENDRVKMSFNATSGVNCTDLKSDILKEFIKNYIANTVGDSCACGLSPYLISYGTFDCSALTVTWMIKALNVDQRELINSTFYSTLKETTCLKNNSLCLTKPCHNCGHVPSTGGKGKGGSINVTVAVVITCILVFLIIVVVVIIYIRKKRRGIFFSRQFRMTRLNEDDDDLIGQDTDDFVGSQDASFSGAV